MIKILIGIFVVICIISIVAILFVLTRNNDDDYYEYYDEDEYDQTPAQSPLGLANNQNLVNFQQGFLTGSAPVDELSVSRVESSLMIAQGFMSQQRYDEAETELKKGLTFVPKDSSLQLKLLNLYAVTNNMNAFSAIFAEVVSHGNTDEVQQAKNLKAMLDAEQASRGVTRSVEPANPTNDETTTVEEKEDDTSLDFSAFTASINEESKKSSENEDNGLSFDDALFSDNERDDEKIEAKSVEKAETTDDMMFFGNLSLSLDDEKASEPAPASVTAKEDSDSRLDFDLSVMADDKEVATDRSSLEIDSLFAEASKLADEQEENIENLSTIDEEALDNFDFEDFGLENTVKSNAKTDKAKGETAKVETSVENELPSFDEFDLGSLMTEEVNGTTETEITKDELPNFDEFDLGGLMTEEVKDTTKTEKTSVNNELPRVNTLNSPEKVTEENPLDLVDTEDKIADFKISNNNNVQLPTDFLKDDITEKVIEQKVAKPKAKVTSAITASIEKQSTSTNTLETKKKLSVLNDIDNNQIILYLAKNYLDLGEYDSAKRLLTEVIEVGTEEQQTEAKSLLARVD